MVKDLGLTAIFVMAFVSMSAQTIGWHKKDLEVDGVFGISLEQAFTLVDKEKQAKTVVVAVIDTGIDTSHTDLKQNLWTQEVTGIHGWNYIGVETGREDVTILASENKEFYDSLSYTFVPEIYRAGYKVHRKTVPELSYKINVMQRLIDELNTMNSKDAEALKRKAQFHLEHGLNPNNMEEDTANGDSDVTPDIIVPVRKPNPTPTHGTHVSGIIASLQYGIARHAHVMMLKSNGNIRELRDKALAKAIRFAVDNGAKVINCSFGKPYTWAKNEVDDAISYANSKEVLIIHAAGNTHQNNDVLPNYPDPKDRTNWMVVGASDKEGNSGKG